MITHRLFRRNSAERRGTTVVEAALVLPVYLMFLFALMEFGHAMMINNVLRSACRSGARLGSTEGQSTAAVKAHVEEIIRGAVDPSDVDIYVKNAGVFDGAGTPPSSGPDIEALPNIELADAEERQMFLVRAKVDYLTVAIVPIQVPVLGAFLDEIELSSQAFMRHE